jgi:hypothetical protein
MINVLITGGTGFTWFAPLRWRASRAAKMCVFLHRGGTATDHRDISAAFQESMESA